MVYTIKGIKYYPIGSWNGNQHKFYHYHDVCFLKMVDDSYSEDSVSKFEEADELLNLFDSLPQSNGVVYAPYNDYKRLKAIIQWYG